MFCQIFLLIFFILCFENISKINGKFFKFYDSQYYSNSNKNYYSTTTEDENSTTTESGNRTYDDSYNSFNIRYLKALVINANITIDIEISKPIKNDSSLDFDIPITIMIQNKTLIKLPYPDKPIKIPLFYPVIKLPKLFSSNRYSQQQQQPQIPYYLPEDNYYSYPYESTSDLDDGYSDIYDYLDQPVHHLSKRHLAAHSTMHKLSIFKCLELALDRYGFDGETCLKRAICQLNKKNFLIDSVVGEVIEHLLTVSRSFDEEHILDRYLEAENYGNTGDDCLKHYPCLFSIFEEL